MVVQCVNMLKKVKKNYVHRFICECYNGLIPYDLNVDHTNDVRDDNRQKGREGRRSIDVNHTNLMTFDSLICPVSGLDSLFSSRPETGGL